MAFHHQMNKHQIISLSQSTQNLHSLGHWENQFHNNKTESKAFSGNYLRLDRIGQAFSRRDTAPAVSADTRGRVSQQLKQCGYPINQSVHYAGRYAVYDTRSGDGEHFRANT